MADTVRHFMEEMVPELEDLEDKGYFSTAEVKEIVRKREHFEYAVKRRTPSKADFLRYIEYETSLEELMRLRKDALHIKANIGKGELGSVKRCHILYDRATRRFRGDLRLWLSWIEYCKSSNSGRMMSKVLTKSLQLHPKEPGLWIYAAAWEFENNKNTGAARSLMQQGLRVCSSSEQMWLEYLRMELAYAQKLRARQKVLGINTDEKGKALEEDEQVEEESHSAMKAVLNGSVARIVLKNALQGIPHSLPFRRDLERVISEFSVPGTAVLTEDLYTDIEAKFPDDELAWDMRARRQSGQLATTSSRELDSNQPLTEPGSSAIEVYEQAVASLPTQDMFDFYIAFLLEQIKALATEQSSGEAGLLGQRLTAPQKKVAKQIFTILAGASQQGALSEGSAIMWPELALACGRVKEALKAVQQGTAAHSSSGAIWTQAVLLLKQQALLETSTASEGLRETLKTTALKAIQSVPGDQSEELWQLVYGTFRELGWNLEQLLQAFRAKVMEGGRGPLKGGLGSIAAKLLQRLRQDQGLHRAREFQVSLLKLPPAGGDFFHAVINMEKEELESRLPDNQLQAVFEAALGAYGKMDTKIWLEYAAFEQKRGYGTGKIYWRATKELEDPSEFVAQMQSSK